MEQAVINRDGSVTHGTDKSLYVEFFMQAIEDEELSREHGRPIFRDREFIKIIPLGDKNTVVCRPVNFTAQGQTPADTDRWPVKYQQFKSQQEQVEEGTPITEWPPLTKSQALNLKGINIHTVEQLAAVQDNNLANIGMGARELREKAKAFIEASESTAGLNKLQSENEDLKIQVQALKAQIEAFGKMLEKKEPELAAPAIVLQPEAVQSPEPINFTVTSSYGKRGRPPKQKENIQ